MIFYQISDTQLCDHWSRDEHLWLTVFASFFLMFVWIREGGRSNNSIFILLLIMDYCRKICSTATIDNTSFLNVVSSLFVIFIDLFHLLYESLYCKLRLSSSSAQSLRTFVWSLCWSYYITNPDTLFTFLRACFVISLIKAHLKPNCSVPHTVQHTMIPFNITGLTLLFETIIEYIKTVGSHSSSYTVSAIPQ